MKRSNTELQLGIMGLVLSSIILLIANQLGSKFDVWAIVLPWIVFISFALKKHCKYVKK